MSLEIKCKQSLFGMLADSGLDKYKNMVCYKAYMRQIIAKFMVLCLLVISVHAATGGEHSPVFEGETLSQVQNVDTVTVSDDHMPPHEKQVSSECNVCHAAHVLLVYAPDNLEFNLYSGRQYDGRALDVFTSHIVEITHPPIISV